MSSEFDSLRAGGLKDLDSLLAYLKKFGIKLKPPTTKGFIPFDSIEEPKSREVPEVKRACVLARYALANSIYSDYTELERTRMTNVRAAENAPP